MRGLQKFKARAPHKKGDLRFCEISDKTGSTRSLFPLPSPAIDKAHASHAPAQARLQLGGPLSLLLHRPNAPDSTKVAACLRRGSFATSINFELNTACVD